MAQVPENIKEFSKNKAAMIGVSVIGLLLLLAISANFISPCDPNKISLKDRLQPPSTHHLMGTDNLGRDLLSRVIFGARTTFEISFIIVIVTAAVGVTIGIISGFYGGVVDEVLMRIVDVLLSFPSIILALVIIGALGPGIVNTVIAVSIVGWLYFARVSRASTLSIKQKEYIEGARALGCSDFYICTRYILPNCISQIFVLMTLNLGSIILTISALGFLGLGARPPTAEWGTMLNDGREFLRDSPWLTVFPGIMIIITVLAFNFIGDGLRDLLDPRHQVIK
jgi:peptide/nickel transport system permease protein